jgi:hypothetical protein
MIPLFTLNLLILHLNNKSLYKYLQNVYNVSIMENKYQQTFNINVLVKELSTTYGLH